MIIVHYKLITDRRTYTPKESSRASTMQWKSGSVMVHTISLMQIEIRWDLSSHSYLSVVA